MKCEFEEKQYEQALNFELLQGHNALYVPGQVLEGQIGFDSAVFTSHAAFWSYFYNIVVLPNSLPKGTKIRREWWDTLEENIEYFPDIKLNLFIQHKRPEFISSSNGKEWKFWEKGYYRYHLTPHQQLALAQLEVNVQKNALVVYASPAFFRLNELWETSENNELVVNSNFCNPSNLVGHNSYSYSEAGSKGIAHSDPMPVESINLTYWLSELQVAEKPGGSTRKTLIQLGNAMNEAAVNTEYLRTNYNNIYKDMAADSPSEFVTAVARLAAFLFVTNLSWYIVTEPE